MKKVLSIILACSILLTAMASNDDAEWYIFTSPLTSAAMKRVGKDKKAISSQVSEIAASIIMDMMINGDIPKNFKIDVARYFATHDAPVASCAIRIAWDNTGADIQRVEIYAIDMRMKRYIEIQFDPASSRSGVGMMSIEEQAEEENSGLSAYEIMRKYPYSWYIGLEEHIPAQEAYELSQEVVQASLVRMEKDSLYIPRDVVTELRAIGGIW